MKLRKDNGTYCPRLWKGLQIDSDGTLRPCCLWQHEVGRINEISSLEDLAKAFDSDEVVQQAREDAITGIKNPECRYCYREEQNLGCSTRTGTIWQEPEDKRYVIPEKAEFHYIDFRPNSLCNLNCKMCGPRNSTKWNQILNGSSEPWVKKEKRDMAVEYIRNHIKDLREMYFAGGEPLIIPEHWEVLKMIVKNKLAIAIRYNTNLTSLVYKKENVLDYWKKHVEQGGTINLAISLDGVGDTIEYIRQGCKWETVKANLDKIVEAFPQRDYRFELNCVPCITVLNVLRVPEMLEVLTKEYPTVKVVFGNISFGPEPYSIYYLPKKLKEVISEHLIQVRNKSNNEVVKEYVGVVLAEMNKTSFGYEAPNVPIETYEAIFEKDPKFNKINPEIANWWTWKDLKNDEVL